jgi:hypothetical protein
MTTYTRKEALASEYWDFYKEVYNVRPRWINFEGCSEEDLEAMLGQLTEQAKAVFAEQERAEQRAIERFEALVASTIASGAKTREDALRWLMEASGCNGDWNYFAWDQGIPYSYFRKAA